MTTVLGISAAVGADGGPNITVMVDGHAISSEATPVMINDHVYVPVRYVAQALGLAVQWDGNTSTVYIGTVPEAGAAGGGAFDYQGLHYSATGLQIRQYPGQQATSGAYWIVSYSITNNGTQPVNVPQQEPALTLFGPGGAQLSPDSSLSGPAPGVVNPGITFSSYLVFQVPVGALPTSYTLGFDTYQVVGSQFTTTPISAALAPSSSTEMATPVGSSYSVTNVWNAAAQKIGIDRVVQTTQIVPDLTAASFNPGTTFWVVDFDVTNPGPANISFSAGDFALNLNGYDSIAPAPVTSLPGYVAPSSLTQNGGVTLGPGDTFSGSLLFDVPTGTSTNDPGLALSLNGQTRIVSIEPCSTSCPAIRQ